MSPGNHRPSERETILSGASEPPKSCGFLSIAPELRDMIYSELIPSGDTAILQVSKQLYDEAKDDIYKQGICRLQFLCNMDYFFVIDPPESQLSKVQKFNLKFNFEYCQHGLHFSDRNRRLLGQARRIDPGLQPYVQGPGSCHVTLVFQSADAFYMPDSVLVLMEYLGTFKLVTLRIHFNFIYHNWDRRNRSEVQPPHKTILERMSAILEESLGDPDWKSEPCHGPLSLSRLPINPFPSAPYLEFHPPRDEISESELGSTVLHV